MQNLEGECWDDINNQSEKVKTKSIASPQIR